ncbi:hypothetical protein NZK32_15375 [Cyanobium sp. FGCU-52]|nr:hypothetical protein [Cyanobium sp. FGCU52]
MIKRLEQVAALVVAAGLAIVSYWLFFSWAQGGGVDRRHRPARSERVFVPADRILAAAVPRGSAADREVATSPSGPLRT